jgi:chemotaxis protein CheD
MNILINASPHPAQHCGAVQRLRVRTDLPQAAPARHPGSRRIGTRPRSAVTLHIGEVAASKSPVVLGTLLGSCVAVCLHDPVLGAGGMNHILLPKCRVGDISPRCGVHAMELLINELMKLGGDRRRFIAKAFGGANVIRGIKMPPIGLGNANFVRNFLATERIPLVSQRLGGNHAVHVFFRTDTGKATVHTVDGSSLPRIINEERSYFKNRAGDKAIGDDIILF